MLPAHFDLSDAWREVRAALRRQAGESTFEVWLAALRAREYSGGVLVLEAPPDTCAWISARFGRLLERCCSEVLGRPVRVELAVEPAQGQRRAAPVASATATMKDSIELAAPVNPRHNFDQFVIGDGNRLAHAASLAAAELPGQSYNPLFLYAPPGLGKTHLLHAVANYALEFGGGANVRYTTVETFTNDFVSALASRSLHRFKHAYRDADILLIDDVQFLARKVKTEEEFFHTFNALYETGRQLVLTCDRLPHELVSVEERLRERFESGLVAEISPPDFATRLTILRKRALLDHIPLADPAVLELIAERVTANVRALQGALIRVVAYHSLTRRPIDVALAEHVLCTIQGAERSRAPDIGAVQRAVADHFGLSAQDLASASRAARVAWPRQLAIHLARDLTHATLGQIGTAFGGRNHATIHYACGRVSERLVNEPATAAEIDALRSRIHADRGS